MSLVKVTVAPVLLQMACLCVQAGTRSVKAGGGMVDILDRV